MYKLLALDLDGTLLRGDSTISYITKEALKKAQSYGVKVVIATGRPLQGIMNYIEELDLIGEDEYVLAYNGSSVYNTITLTPIIRNGLTGEEVKEIYRLSKKLGVEFHGFTDEECIATRENKYTDAERTHNKVPISLIDFDNDLKDDDFIIKVMIMEEESILNNVIDKIPNEFFEKYHIVRSTSFMLEFMNKNCSKSSGLNALANHLGIGKDEIVACGDAENDIDMIEFAGLGVAMENANDLVKSKADYITLSNENDGIADMINKKILNY
ncbi:Cof-type HAD-IIB family hydrolase [Clostridium sp. LP20]|uniref:Cof-type HAD-IIB family hydrolase n=1 Tax=Clostridium sp. LP20 TaxID=3418665 RepID=UPI003EE465B6